MYQHPGDNYQPQHPHLEFEHSESVWSSIKSAAGIVGGAVSRGAERVSSAASRAKKSVKRKIFRAGLSKEDRAKMDAEDPDKVDEAISNAQKKKGNKSDDEDGSDEEEEEAYWSDEEEDYMSDEYTPMHPHLQGDFEPSAWPGRKKKKGGGKITKKKAIKLISKTALVNDFLKSYNDDMKKKDAKTKKLFAQKYKKWEAISSSNASIPAIIKQFNNNTKYGKKYGFNWVPRKIPFYSPKSDLAKSIYTVLKGIENYGKIPGGKADKLWDEVYKILDSVK